MIDPKIPDELKKLKKERNAVLLAHYYQEASIQDAADFLGDSLMLSRKATEVQEDTIVFCGVHFMAESAYILNPGKTILLPVLSAGCPMAATANARQVQLMKQMHPEAAVVCYVNSSAEVKAESDICCTSSNAVSVVKSLPEKKILFLPDGNLARYVARFVPDKKIIPWEGCCHVHDKIQAADVERARKTHPEAVVLVHPECREEVIDRADFTGSTDQILKWVKASDKREFIIGTESGILHPLKKNNPDKIFYPLRDNLICPDMKLTSMNDVLVSLRENKHVIKVEETVRVRALRALERMLAVN